MPYSKFLKWIEERGYILNQHLSDTLPSRFQRIYTTNYGRKLLVDFGRCPNDHIKPNSKVTVYEEVF